MKVYKLTKEKYLSGEEKAQLDKTLKTNEGTRDGLFISLALNTGARISELLYLTKADLNDDNQSVYIHGLKNSNDREIPLIPTLYLRLKAYSAHEVGPRIFNISYDRMYQIWQLYKPGKKKFHSLRHTFAVELYKRTRDIRLVQVALGHRSISNTMVYMDYVYSQEELRRLLI